MLQDKNKKYTVEEKKDRETKNWKDELVLDLETGLLIPRYMIIAARES